MKTQKTIAIPLEARRCIGGDHFEIYDAKGMAVTGWGSVTQTEDEAHFIVSRCNVHDDLVKALRELMADEGYDKWDAEQIEYEESVGRGIAPTIRLAHAALAKIGAL